MTKGQKIVLFIAVMGILLSSTMLFRTAYEYRSAEKEYEALKIYTSVERDAAGSTGKEKGVLGTAYAAVEDRPETKDEPANGSDNDEDMKPGDDAALAVKSGDDEADDAGFQDSAADPKKPETVKNGDRSDKADKTDEADKADEADGADELTKTRGLIVSKVIEKTGSKPDEEDDRIVLKELERNYERGDFPEMDIDFESLSEINPDVVAWVYVGATKIDYPVVQTEDNEFYLHQTFEGKKNSSGCIFMDWEVNKDLSSPNTFIYGHNMKNGSMFGSLKQFIWNEKTYDKDPYIFVYIPGYIYRYKIFSFYLDQPDSKMYYTCDNLKEYRAYIRDAVNMSVHECDIEATAKDNIVTLVTCSGSGASKQRFFVHGVLLDRYEY